MSGCPVHHHGVTKARGCSHAAVSTFSKLFPTLPGVVVTEPDAALLGGPGGLMHDFDGKSNDCDIPAGYIFFAQFIDHDVTLDATSDLRSDPNDPDPDKRIDVDTLPNIRSASLDLDCVYGFGPEGSPHIYDGDRPGRLAISPNGYDLARSPSGAALIGDPRNDENIFVSQLQLLFHRFHNKLYNERVYQENKSEPFNRFEEAQKQTRYHYQWLVLFDFLKRLCDPQVYRFTTDLLLSNQPDQHPRFPLIYRPNAHNKLTMPVEFSVAAYRVGHTMVRSVYAANGSNLDVELFDPRFGTEGFTALPSELEVDWRYLLEVDDCIRPRMSKAIDPLLADEIQNLPVVNSNNPNDRALAFRNLLRGNAMGLASGQAVAGALVNAGYPIQVPPTVDLQLGNLPSALQDNTPLFYYILQESKVNNNGQRLGPVGSAILMEVFGGMLTFCDSFLKEEEEWNPDPCVSREKRLLWPDTYREGFNRRALIEREGYYPFDLADVVRFVGEGATTAA